MLQSFYPENFLLIVPLHQEKRLLKTCFRPNQECSGNFNRWHSCESMLLHDPFIRHKLKRLVQQSIKEMEQAGKRQSEWAFTFDYPKFVGWASTIPQHQLPSGTALEMFHPNPHTAALAVKPGQPILAPPTKQITLICTITKLKKGEVESRDGLTIDWKVTIHSLYPGYEVQLGWKNEPRTIQPEHAVFFRFDHPGAPITTV